MPVNLQAATGTDSPAANILYLTLKHTDAAWSATPWSGNHGHIIRQSNDSLMSEVPEGLLGYTSGRHWLDMSGYVAHFTDSETAFGSILREGFPAAKWPIRLGSKFR